MNAEETNSPVSCTTSGPLNARPLASGGDYAASAEFPMAPTFAADCSACASKHARNNVPGKQEV